MKKAQTNVFLRLDLDLKNKATLVATSRKIKGLKGTLKGVISEALTIGLEFLEDADKQVTTIKTN